MYGWMWIICEIIPSLRQVLMYCVLMGLPVGRCECESNVFDALWQNSGWDQHSLGYVYI